MITIDKDSSCVFFAISKRLGEEKLIKAISKSIGLVPFVDVVIVNDVINNEPVYNNAKLYVEIYKIPEGGIPIFCDICSANIHKIITDWTAFLTKLSLALESEIYINFFLGKVYCIELNGTIQQKEYAITIVDGIECIYIKE